jgi:hypothetical protein
VNSWNLIPIVLLVLFGAALGCGLAITLFAWRWHRKYSRPFYEPLIYRQPSPLEFAPPRQAFLLRPSSWLAVHSRRPAAVQSALGLHNARPCTWMEGLANDRELFIAPPVNGWILIVGSGLPDPVEDVDACFRFLLDLSRKLGHVQFFHANTVSGHHAWVRAESGRIVRAYVWAGETLWNQGIKTRAELELGLKCFRYLETPESALFGQPEISSANVNKVPLLASRWSFDPASIELRELEQASGIAGEAPRQF